MHNTTRLSAFWVYRITSQFDIDFQPVSNFCVHYCCVFSFVYCFYAPVRYFLLLLQARAHEDPRGLGLRFLRYDTISNQISTLLELAIFIFVNFDAFVHILISKQPLVMSLVHSRLHCGNFVLIGLAAYLQMCFQSKVLNAAARLVFRLRRYDDVTDALATLHRTIKTAGIITIPPLFTLKLITATPSTSIFLSYTDRVQLVQNSLIRGVVKVHKSCYVSSPLAQN